MQNLGKRADQIHKVELVVATIVFGTARTVQRDLCNPAAVRSE